MDRIVISGGAAGQQETFVRILAILFPECEIEIASSASPGLDTPGLSFASCPGEEDRQ
jgi:hypothetical protein